MLRSQSRLSQLRPGRESALPESTLLQLRLLIPVTAVPQLVNALTGVLATVQGHARRRRCCRTLPSNPTVTAPSPSSADPFDLPHALARWGEILRGKLLADPAMGGWTIEPVVKEYLNFTRKPQQQLADSSSAAVSLAAAAASPASLPFAASTAASAGAALPPGPLSQASSFTFSSLGTWRSILTEKHGIPRQESPGARRTAGVLTRLRRARNMDSGGIGRSSTLGPSGGWHAKDRGRKDAAGWRASEVRLAYRHPYCCLFGCSSPSPVLSSSLSDFPHRCRPSSYTDWRMWRFVSSCRPPIPRLCCGWLGARAK